MMENKTLLLVLIMMCLGASKNLAQTRKLSGDEVKVINELIFDHNLHHHRAYTQSHRIKSRKLGNIKKETINYGNGNRTTSEYLRNGNYKYIKSYKNDTLKSEYLYEYKGDKLVKERGVYEVDYKYEGEYDMIGLNPRGDRGKFYRAKDTIFIKDKWNRYEVVRNLKDGNDWNERFVFHYNTAKDLKKIDIYYNHIRSGIVLNKFDTLRRVKEHHHIHSFSSFVEESKWQRNFQNSVYLFEYNDLGFIKKYRVEFYNGETRQWEGKDTSIEYEFLGTERNPVIKLRMKKEGKIKVNQIELDEKGNWTSQLKTYDNNTKIIKREIEYY